MCANVNIADIYGAVTKAYWSELSLLLDSVFQICEKLIKFNPVRSHSIICDSQAVNEDNKLARIACLLVLGNVGKLDVGIFSLIDSPSEICLQHSNSLVDTRALYGTMSSDRHYLGGSIHAL